MACLVTKQKVHGPAHKCSLRFCVTFANMKAIYCAVFVVPHQHPPGRPPFSAVPYLTSF